MTDSVAGVVLAAGAARRLQPISALVPKPLCPVGNRTLLHRAIGRLRGPCGDVAVNVHHHAASIIDAVSDDDVRISREEPEPLGTVGAIGALREWIDACPVAIVNADTFCPGDMQILLEGWGGTTVRLWVPGGGAFGPRSPVVGCLLPRAAVQTLEPRPSGLYEVVWRDWHAKGLLEVVPYGGIAIDCGTPRRLLEANLAALDIQDAVAIHPTATVTGSVRASAVGAGALVAGSVVSSVVFPGAFVHESERLERVIRYGGPSEQLTVLIR